MKKTGRVLNFDKNKVYIVTSENEFVTVERHKETPIKDKLYRGEEITKTSKTVFTLTIVILACFLSIYILKFFFFTSDANIVIKFDRNIKIGINNNKIVEVTPVGGGSLQLVDTTSVMGNEINDGLIILLDEALKQKLIRNYTGYDRGQISVYIIKAGHREPLNFTKFIDYAYDRNYDILLNKNDNKIPE